MMNSVARVSLLQEVFESQIRPTVPQQKQLVAFIQLELGLPDSHFQACTTEADRFFSGYALRKLYAEIARMNVAHAGKITGMMLEPLACILASHTPS